MRLGTLGDLEQAIERAEATSKSHPDRAGILSSLGTFLHRKYTRLGALEDLQQAIRWAKTTIQATPLGHLDREQFGSLSQGQVCTAGTRRGPRTGRQAGRRSPRGDSRRPLRSSGTATQPCQFSPQRVQPVRSPRGPRTGDPAGQRGTGGDTPGPPGSRNQVAQPRVGPG